MGANRLGICNVHIFLSAALLQVALLCFPTVSSAQLLQRALVVEGARIVLGADDVIEDGSIVIKGGRITAIGSEVDVPFLAKRESAAGKTITAGLIDSWSGLGGLEEVREADATSNAWDGFDRYAIQRSRHALRYGVTTVYLSPGTGTGITGTGSVAKLAPNNGGIGKVVVREAALCINLGSEAAAVARLKIFRKVRKAFRGALDYREALEDYEEELKEYEEKLAERRKKKEEAEKEKGGEVEEEADKGEEERKDEAEQEKGDKPEPKPGRLSAGNGDNNDKTEPDSEKKKEKDEEELKKPSRPKPDRTSEMLLRAIDHELPVRVTAHRSADILNALSLADEFNLDIVLEGATDAYLLAADLKDVSVFLGQSSRGTLFDDDEYQRHSASAPGVLESNEVRWTVGSGVEGALATRFVALNAQVASRSLRQPGVWLELLTSRAASMLGLPKRYGQLRRGNPADFVVWSGDPSESGSKVDFVYIGGEVAFDRRGLEGGGS